MTLNIRQKAFVEHYIELGNAEQAAIKAGYSERYARGNAYKLVANSGIKKYIDKRVEELKADRVADQQEILELLTAIARGEARASTLIGLGGGAEAIENDMPPTMNERIKAAEMLGKRYAMWTDKLQTEDITPTFVNDVPADD